MSIANAFDRFNATQGPFKRMTALTAKANEKYDKYQIACDRQNLGFLPFICGSLGFFNEPAEQLIKDLGTAWSSAADVSRDWAICEIRRRISFSVQKDQASAWLRRGRDGGVLL